MIVSFDFDDCLCLNDLPNPSILAIIQKRVEDGDEIHITTARSGKRQLDNWNQIVEEWVSEHNLPISKVHYTNHSLKGPFLVAAGASHHYDDKLEHLFSACIHGVKAFLVIGEDIHEIKYTPLGDD